LADGSIASVRTDRLSLVSSLASAVSEVGLDIADHHMDGEHYPHLRGLAFAYAWTSLGGSWLDHVARIRIGRDSEPNNRFAAARTTGSVSMLNGPGGINLRGARFVNPKTSRSNPTLTVHLQKE
jgi:hypothetical protein